MKRRAYVIAVLILLAPVRAAAQVALIGCTTGIGTTTSLPINASGNIIVLCISSSGQPGLASGYTRLSPASCTNTNSNIDVQYKVAGSSESAPTLSGSSFYSWAICTFSGQAASPWEAQSSNNSVCTTSNSTTNVVAPQISTTVQQDFYIACSSLGAAYTNGSSGLTQDKTTQFAGGSNYGITFQHTPVPTPTPGAFTLGTQTNSSVSNRAMALIPGATATATPTITATATPTASATPTATVTATATVTTTVTATPTATATASCRQPVIPGGHRLGLSASCGVHL